MTLFPINKLLSDYQQKFIHTFLTFPTINKTILKSCLIEVKVLPTFLTFPTLFIVQIMTIPELSQL